MCKKAKQGSSISSEGVGTYSLKLPCLSSSEHSESPSHCVHSSRMCPGTRIQVQTPLLTLPLCEHISLSSLSHITSPCLGALAGFEPFSTNRRPYLCPLFFLRCMGHYYQGLKSRPPLGTPGPGPGFASSPVPSR